MVTLCCARELAPTLLAEKEREPPMRQGGNRGGLAKRRTTNKLFVLRLAPSPKNSPTRILCAGE